MDVPTTFTAGSPNEVQSSDDRRRSANPEESCHGAGNDAKAVSRPPSPREGREAIGLTVAPAPSGRWHGILSTIRRCRGTPGRRRNHARAKAPKNAPTIHNRSNQGDVQVALAVMAERTRMVVRMIEAREVRRRAASAPERRCQENT